MWVHHLGAEGCVQPRGPWCVLQEWLPGSGPRQLGRLSILKAFCKEDELQRWRQVRGARACDPSLTSRVAASPCPPHPTPSPVQPSVTL